MNNTIEEMLKNYNVNNIYDKKRNKRNITRDCVMWFSTSCFFKDAAFYGGTALRFFMV